MDVKMDRNFENEAEQFDENTAENCQTYEVKEEKVSLGKRVINGVTRFCKKIAKPVAIGGSIALGAAIGYGAGIIKGKSLAEASQEALETAAEAANTVEAAEVFQDVVETL